MTVHYKIAGYLRLSRDDKNGSQESLSIDNQRRILADYAQKNGWTIKEFYIDDGYSGTNFERPDFERLIQDIESGKINCVITKDLSRLGRNYSKIGFYTEEYFPEHGVRYIAINDCVDTLGGGNDFAAFHNVINEFYPKEISRKVRQVKRANAEKGMFMGSRAPFGYRKDPGDKHKLIIDEEAAAIIRRVFREYNNGDNGRLISQKLTAEGILCPRAYFYQKNDGVNPKKENMTWCSNTVLQIIDNPVYIGTLTQGKRQMISYKSKKRRLTDPEEWVVVENNHEPIIDMDTWNTAQKFRKIHQRIHTKKNDYSQAIFSGLLLCADCGASMTPTLLGRNKKMTYRCGTYVGHSKEACSSHTIREEVLEEIVLSDIHTYAKLAVEERDKLIQDIIQCKQEEGRSDTTTLQRKIQACESKIAELKKAISCLYKDKVLGNLPEETCFSLIQEYQGEISQLEKTLPGMKAELQQILCSNHDAEKWTALISSYVDIAQLNRTLARALIEKITISDKYELNEETIRDIQITYRFVGNLATPLLSKTKDVA